MPHTVRPAGRAISPAASIANVVNVGAVKHGRNSSSSSASDPGSLLTRSIGGTLCEEFLRHRRCFLTSRPRSTPRTASNARSPRVRNSRGYAVTDHAAQGRTVHTGLAVITGTEDRQHAYVALTRGTDVNTAYVFTLSPKLADPAPGPRPAPELARYDRITAGPGDQPATGTGEALTVLCGVLERDGQLLSATQTLNQALADADHLAILHAIWAAETTPAREQRYQALLEKILPPGYRSQSSHQVKWLWRTLRGAELAGLDAGQVLATAVGEAGPGRSPRHPQRHRRPDPPPGRLPGPVPARPLVRAAPRHRRPRTLRLRWAEAALGPVPDHPLDRLDWQRRASSIGAWRELSGYDHPTDPIGPEPVAAAPDARASWHGALAALGPADGPDVRGTPDGG